MQARGTKSFKAEYRIELAATCQLLQKTTAFLQKEAKSEITSDELNEACQAAESALMKLWRSFATYYSADPLVDSDRQLLGEYYYHAGLFLLHYLNRAKNEDINLVQQYDSEGEPTGEVRKQMTHIFASHYRNPVRELDYRFILSQCPERARLIRDSISTNKSNKQFNSTLIQKLAAEVSKLITKLDLLYASFSEPNTDSATLVHKPKKTPAKKSSTQFTAQELKEAKKLAKQMRSKIATQRNKVVAQIADEKTKDPELSKDALDYLSSQLKRFKAPENLEILLAEGMMRRKKSLDQEYKQEKTSTRELNDSASEEWAHITIMMKKKRCVDLIAEVAVLLHPQLDDIQKEFISVFTFHFEDFLLLAENKKFQHPISKKTQPNLIANYLRDLLNQSEEHMRQVFSSEKRISDESAEQLAKNLYESQLAKHARASRVALPTNKKRKQRDDEQKSIKPSAKRVKVDLKTSKSAAEVHSNQGFFKAVRRTRSQTKNAALQNQESSQLKLR
jgi:hypothetical protein